ncbi:MAG: nucleotidyltransferase domain-containing protein [Desulfobacterales bacterium]|nr:nucleotidyltransferase domain-containing protein [Desulfobacterales bacterium]MBF0396687.1 nucleotidyltransferase domain-containing protein [Desulfobacterales bacterium]
MKFVKNEIIIKKVQQELDKIESVVSAYIFGSILKKGVFNDIDILILLNNQADKNSIFLELPCNLARSLNISSNKIDILNFDLREANPIVLIKAVKGRLIKNVDDELLTDKLEELSCFFLMNEPILYYRKELLRELLYEY